MPRVWKADRYGLDLSGGERAIKITPENNVVKTTQPARLRGLGFLLLRQMKQEDFRLGGDQVANAQSMIDQIELTLAELYGKVHSEMTQKDRSMVLQRIAHLESSLVFWERRQSRLRGTRPSVATIDLGGF